MHFSAIYYSLSLQASEMKSCHQKYQLGDLKISAGPIHCEKLCTKNKACKFYFYGESKWCLIYMSCEEQRDIDMNGITYKKERHGNCDWKTLDFWYLQSINSITTRYAVDIFCK